MAAQNNAKRTYYIWANISKSKVGDCSRGWPEGSFSIATTPRCWEGRYSFPWIAPLFLWYVSYIAVLDSSLINAMVLDSSLLNARRNQVPFLKFLVWRDLGLNPGLPDYWRTLYPLGQWAVLSKYNTQQNSECKLCRDKDETVNNIISECSKLVWKDYKTNHDWVGKVIHWELCNGPKFDPRLNGICVDQYPS